MGDNLRRLLPSSQRGVFSSFVDFIMPIFSISSFLWSHSCEGQSRIFINHPLDNFVKRIFFLLFCLISLFACQPTPRGVHLVEASQPPLISRSTVPADFVRVNTVALLPPELDRTVRQVVGGDKDLLSLLEDAAATGAEFQIVPESKLKEALKGHSNTSDDAKKVGLKVGADALLITKLLRYEDRVGSSVGADSPAKVDFAMSLVRVSDGKLLWDGNYHFGDQALSENLLKIKDHFGTDGKAKGWRTARELLTDGFRAAFKDIAEKRRAAFVEKQ